MSGVILMDAREVRLMIQKIALLELQIEKNEAITRFKNEVRREIYLSKEETMTRVSKVVSKRVVGGKAAERKPLTQEQKKGQGQRLGFFAKVGGFTLKALGEKTNIAYPRMKKIAQGIRELTDEERARLAKVTNINPEWLENGGRALIMAKPVLAGRRAK